MLVTHGITKRFPGIVALNDVSITFEPGKVHVLFGENGAGKSTLINIIAGVYRADQGSLSLDGRRLAIHSVSEARSAGISAMFQEFSLAPDLPVFENITLGREKRAGGFYSRARNRRDARQALESLQFDLDIDALVRTLPRAQQQMVEMAKALLQKPRVLILDEPTSSLTEKETRTLFNAVRMLRDSGVVIIYITHRIAELNRIGDTVTVLRDGNHIETLPVRDISEKSLVELMTGRSFGNFFPEIPHRPGDCVLAVDNLSTRDGAVRNASLQAFAGEVVGLAGLVGSGKSEIVRVIYGAAPFGGGTIKVDGESVLHPTPSGSLRRGFFYLPSDRMNEGILSHRSFKENVSVTSLEQPQVSRAGFLRRASEIRSTAEAARQVDLRPMRIEREIGLFSGGNQQKSIIARALARPTRILLLDEPTIGVDVNAKREIYAMIASFVSAGTAVVLVSSDMAEILNLCHRVYVVRDGCIVTHMKGAEISESRILESFFDQRDGGLVQ